MADVEPVVDDEAEEDEADHSKHPEDNADGSPLAAEALVGRVVDNAATINALGADTALAAVHGAVHAAVDIITESGLSAADQEANSDAHD